VTISESMKVYSAGSASINRQQTLQSRADLTARLARHSTGAVGILLKRLPFVPPTKKQSVT
jgi:hypothetical protein